MCQRLSISICSSFSDTPPSPPPFANELSRLPAPPPLVIELSLLSNDGGSPDTGASDTSAPHSEGLSLMIRLRPPGEGRGRLDAEGFAEGEKDEREKKRTRKVYSAEALSRRTSMIERKRASGGRI